MNEPRLISPVVFNRNVSTGPIADFRTQGEVEPGKAEAQDGSVELPAQGELPIDELIQEQLILGSLTPPEVVSTASSSVTPVPSESSAKPSEPSTTSSTESGEDSTNTIDEPSFPNLPTPTPPTIPSTPMTDKVEKS